jgi:copper chaperone CopZ
VQVSLLCPEISCGGCAGSIKTATAGMPGVRSLNVDVATKTVIADVEDEQVLEALKNALDDIGFPVSNG